MIIIGAKGFAKELLEVCQQLGHTENLVFFDDVSADLPDKIYGQFPILRSKTEVKEYFKKISNDFALGLGNPLLRKKMCSLFESWGGKLSSVISPHAVIGKFDLQMGPGATILAKATITGTAIVGKGILMYPNAVITHDCTLGDFVELSPGATLLGNCSVGSMTHIGANATILPKLTLGEGVVVGAGAVVTKDVPDNSIVKGVPAR
ncbi:MAG: NeuD/PglB/VioB family sugar acetyltransferase [Candidatus Competibacteraceae bacterium]|nr:NeuD/PglB/VioB family sugar acetyltransferase [Candidatus Competibacteraceae bacterium]